MQEPGPGGGGGGGGNQMPEPPKKAEVPGKEAISVPVTRPETPKPEPKPEEPPDPMMNIPAKTLGDTAQLNPGLLDAAMAASMISQGTGTGGGGGSGKGTGIGPGDGVGSGRREAAAAPAAASIGPATASNCRARFTRPRPNYTADAMRAKVQGTVWVECVVRPDGTCTDANVTKSLDSVFGLDQEAHQGGQAVALHARHPHGPARVGPHHHRTHVYAAIGL